MDLNETSDHQHFVEALGELPHACMPILAYRAALRVAPLAFSARMNLVRNFSDLVLYRVLLTAGVAVSTPNPTIEAVVRKLNKIDAGALVGRGEGSGRALMAFDAALAILPSILAQDRQRAATEVRRCVRIAAMAIDEYRRDQTLDYVAGFPAGQSIIPARAEAFDHHSSAFWVMLNADIKQFQIFGREIDLHPLVEGNAEWLAEANAEADAISQKLPADIWGFWARWWNSVVAGTHLPNDLLTDIAMIPDADWQQGPEHIAAIIADMEERHDRLAQVVALRQRLTLSQSQAASVAHRSHNQPPEVLDDAAEVQEQITIVFDSLDEAEVELSKAEPSRSRLQWLGQRLVMAGKTIAQYCGKVADKFVMSAATAAGAAAGAYGVTLLVKHAADIQSLGKALLEFGMK